MQKTILITGSTDGIGLATAKKLRQQGHRVLLHGRNPQKLAAVQAELGGVSDGGSVSGFVADLSSMTEVEAFAAAVMADTGSLDVLINNAGIFRAANPITAEQLDLRFAVNTLAPYLLTRRLLPLLGDTGRVVNLSSAAQAPVNLQALTGEVQLDDDFAAYAQSKLAITIWSRMLAEELGETGPAIIAVNPGSMLGSKMVQEGFGVAGGDIGIGADILIRAALSEEFAAASGRYFDNDAGRFADPHADAHNPETCAEVMRVIKALLAC
ncbi:SDR family NAD(P)-dependent oxidoreductase [Marinobacterium jannaschii]|uniref:SDR family NAD(P)-dependent oxidoreductase n=1 Tax=Marinobacterium jannaschii TaxID=64970 RepID=UPI000487BA4B|nr:SDR family NAD(P)-dependent oxidoreductase [Marinobacterium jannaschii]